MFANFNYDNYERKNIVKVVFDTNIIDDNDFDNNLAWVDFPAPSPPSKVINLFTSFFSLIVVDRFIVVFQCF